MACLGSSTSFSACPALRPQAATPKRAVHGRPAAARSARLCLGHIGGMFDALKERGFLVETLSHAWAMLSGDFPEVASEIEEILLASTIPIEEIVGSGGGETKARSGCAARSGRSGGASTTSSSSALSTGGRWRASVMKWTTSAQFPAGTVALEIEWNNKDPFFDRDFENFKRLHADGAISLGVMVTRGPDLQDRMHELVRRFADERGIDDFEGVRRIGLTPTPRQIRAITKRVERLKKPVP